MPPRNNAGKRGTTGGSADTTQSDLLAFQRQQKELSKFEGRCEEGQAAEALRLVVFSQAISDASLPRRKAVDDAAEVEVREKDSMEDVF